MKKNESAIETYSDLPHKESAAYRISFNQMLFVILTLSLYLAGLVQFGFTWLKVTLVATLLYYMIDFAIYGLIVMKGLFNTQQSTASVPLNETTDWPAYTILCPLYKEQAVLPQFVAAMKRIDYPKDKLQIMLLLEEDDIDTIAMARRMRLPDYFEIVVVPDSLPKTKPKACNYGLQEATGEYIVIYDAEDIPDPKQLKLAATVHLNSTENIGCVQAKLNFYNPNQNFLTRLFTLEYSLWFEIILPGLMAINAPIPLGGTSNHFPTAFLRELHGWDPYNVTEDADLGMRIAQKGYKTLIIDSTTLEEANSSVTSWIKQRSRWIKGYMQTYLVHTRQMDKFWKHGPKRNALMIHVILGIRSFGILLSAGLLLAFIALRIVEAFGQELIALPGWLFYLLVGNLIFVNLIYMYTYLIGVAKRKQWGIASAVVLVPFYWLLLLIASLQAFYELIFRPFYWQKTTHGLHLSKTEAQENKI